MLANSTEDSIKHLNRFKNRKKKWNSFLKKVETYAPISDKVFNILNLVNEVKEATIECRPYRTCRNYKASEKKLIYSLETYEHGYNRKRNSVRSVKRKRTAKKHKSLNNIDTNLLQEKSIENKVINTPVLNVNDTVILPKTPLLEFAETGSSGYFSTADSRRPSLSSISTIYKNVSTEIIEAMLVKISLKINDGLRSKYPVTMEIIKNLTFIYDLPRNNFKYICLYLKQTKFNIDLSSTVKLVHLIEDIKSAKLKNFIFGMRLFESLNRLTDIKFKEISDKVYRIIFNLFRTVNIDVIEIYVDFILWMFDYKKSKLNCV